VPLQERRLCGLEYLENVTLLLQRAGQARPGQAMWEAADLQWWWTRDQHADPEHQVFWFDGDRPAAAVVITDWGGRYQCDLLSVDEDPSALLDLLWPTASAVIGSLGGDPVEIAISDGDAALIDAATRAGFARTDEVYVPTWLRAGAQPPATAIAPGFTLADRTDAAGRPHHLAGRNGSQVGERLAECSIYRPDLDLCVYAPDGEVAGYCLFWADPVTGVGLIEPMRTEDQFQGKGLARHVLTTGLNRLAAAGCLQLKVSYRADNDAAERLYIGAGFRPASADRTYRLG
jgi:ribosomal protein S18 acetylase RimI-like enzyme